MSFDQAATRHKTIENQYFFLDLGFVVCVVKTPTHGGRAQEFYFNFVIFTCFISLKNLDILKL